MGISFPKRVVLSHHVCEACGLVLLGVKHIPGSSTKLTGNSADTKLCLYFCLYVNDTLRAQATFQKRVHVNDTKCLRTVPFNCFHV